MADTDRVNISRALKSKALLDDPEFKAALSAVRTNILDRIESCPLRDKDGLYCLRLELKLLNDVRANIEHVVNTGKAIEARTSFFERAKKVIHGGY